MKIIIFAVISILTSNVVSALLLQQQKNKNFRGVRLFLTKPEKFQPPLIIANEKENNRNSGLNALNVMLSALCLGSATAAFALSAEDIPVIADIAISSTESIQIAAINAVSDAHAAVSDVCSVTDANIVPAAYLESKIAASTSAAKAVDINWRYFLSGAVCASFSHGVSVPLDVVKTRIQTRPGAKSTESTLEVAKEIIRSEGVGALLQGMVPTLVGFAVQGSLKYGFYDVFKQVITNELVMLDWHWEKLFIFMLAGASAELIGSTCLSPFETVRIQQISASAARAVAMAASTTERTGLVSGGQDSATRLGLIDSFRDIIAVEGTQGLFKALPSMLLKGLPYTVVQLSVFEFLTTAIYSTISELGYSRAEASQYQFLITISTALVAAVLSTLVSQPGDTLMSKTTKAAKKPAMGMTMTEGADLTSKPTRNEFQILSDIVSQEGWKGLFVGLQARLLHVSFFVSVQLLVYDYVKQLCGIPPTGMSH